MKKKILFCSALFIFVILTGCSKEDNAEFLEVNEEYFDFLGVEGDGGSFMVSSNTQWTVTGSADWIKCSPSSGEGDRGVAVSVDFNQGAKIRTGSVTVATPGGITRTVLIAQFGTEPGIIARPETVEVFSGEGYCIIWVTATHEWEAVIPNEAREWLRYFRITSPPAQPEFAERAAYLSYNLNETDAERTANVVFRLTNGQAQTTVNVLQPFIVQPTGIEYPDEVVVGESFTITGENLGSVAKVFLDDMDLGELVEKTDTYVTVTVPASMSAKVYEVKIIYGTKEMVLGDINVIPPFPSVTSIPEKGVIGSSFIIHGTQLSSVEKVMLGSVEAPFVFGRTPKSSMLVTVPETLKTGEVEVKLIYLKSEELEVGSINIVGDFGDISGKDLARYAGSKYPNVPMVIEGGRTNGFNAGGGRSVLFAFDGAIDAVSWGLVDYNQYYVGQMNWNGTSFGTTGVGGAPNSGRTYWQANSGQNEGEIDDGTSTIPSNRTSFWLDYTATPDGYVTFDRLALIGRGNNDDATESFTVEISDNRVNWIKVVKAEDSKEFVGTTVQTYNLPNPVRAKYVRYVVITSKLHNTGLTMFELYCTK